EKFSVSSNTEAQLVVCRRALGPSPERRTEWAVARQARSPLYPLRGELGGFCEIFYVCRTFIANAASGWQRSGALRGCGRCRRVYRPSSVRCLLLVLARPRGRRFRT